MTDTGCPKNCAHFHSVGTVNFLNIRTPKKFVVITLKFELCGSTRRNVCLFVLGFYGPVNNEVMLSRSVNSGTLPGQA